MNKSPELSVIVPVYNEAGNIASMLGEISAALAGKVNFEAIYVDDKSTDDTLARLKQAQAEMPELRIICHLSNAGQSTATRNGVIHARAPWIVTLDGDGQNDPADILELIRVRDADGGEDLRMVAGLRRKRNDSWVRRMSSRIANNIRMNILKDEVSDTGCSLKLFRRDAFMEMPYFDHMHRFLPALIKRGGGRILTLQVNHRPRHAGVSKYGIGNRLWVGIIDMMGVRWLQRRTRLTAVREEKAN